MWFSKYPPNSHIQIKMLRTKTVYHFMPSISVWVYSPFFGAWYVGIYFWFSFSSVQLPTKQNKTEQSEKQNRLCSDWIENWNKVFAFCFEKWGDCFHLWFQLTIVCMKISGECKRVHQQNSFLVNIICTVFVVFFIIYRERIQNKVQYKLLEKYNEYYIRHFHLIKLL